MNVLVGCECSGVIRDEFIRAGHDAISCDLKPTEVPGPHIQDDLFHVLSLSRRSPKIWWDLFIVHPDCTYLTVSNNGPMNNGCSLYTAEEAQRRRTKAIKFFMDCYEADFLHLCLENPVGITSTRFRKPDQYIQPWQFGDDASKKTGLWLKNLPLLDANKYPPRRRESPSRESDTRRAK